MRAPEDDREFDEIVGEHRAADDAGVAVIKLRGGDADAGTVVRILETGRQQAGDDGIIMALEVTTDVVAVVDEPPRVLR
jgi:hypothetical protein